MEDRSRIGRSGQSSCRRKRFDRRQWSTNRGGHDGTAPMHTLSRQAHLPAAAESAVGGDQVQDDAAARDHECVLLLRQWLDGLEGDVSRLTEQDRAFLRQAVQAFPPQERQALEKKYPRLMDALFPPPEKGDAGKEGTPGN